MSTPTTGTSNNRAIEIRLGMVITRSVGSGGVAGGGGAEAAAAPVAAAALGSATGGSPPTAVAARAGAADGSSAALEFTRPPYRLMPEFSAPSPVTHRSEERRVGKEWRCRWGPRRGQRHDA